MEQLSNFQKLSEKQSTEVRVKKNVQVEYLFDGRIIPYQGHTLWQIDLKTMEVSEAGFKKEEVIDWNKAVAEMINPTSVKREVIKKKNCVYISALNQERALERYRQGKGSAILCGENVNHISEAKI